MLLVNSLPQGPYLKGFRHRNAIRLTIQEQRAEKGNSKLVQRQLSRGILTKRFSENMQQICRRTPMPKCYFSKFAKYGCSHVNLLNICRTLFPQNTSVGMHLSVELIKVFKNQLPKYFRKNHDFLLGITLSKKLRMLYLSLSQLAISFLSEPLKYTITANFDVGRVDLIFPLIYFMQLVPSYTPRKYQETYGFLIFLEGIEIDQ